MGFNEGEGDAVRVEGEGRERPKIQGTGEREETERGGREGGRGF